MLYEQIRYAGDIRRLYKISHLLAQKRPPDIGTRLGYPKYSKQFYRIKSRLRREGIISSSGTFVENPPNLHMAAMAMRVDAAQIRVLGHRIPYVLFLTLATGLPRKASHMASGCRFSRKAVYDALGRLEQAGLVRRNGHVAIAEEEENNPARTWLAEYLEAVMVWTDTSGDTSILFNTIPSYVGGPHMHRLSHYEPGAPMGPVRMHIFTYGPLLGLMEMMVNKIRYFRDRPKGVSVMADDDDGRLVQKTGGMRGNPSPRTGS